MNDDYPTLQERLESLSKALESRGRIDEQDHPYAYATILDAMKIEARYRWLRNQNALLEDGAFLVLYKDVHCSHCETTWVGSDLDAAIDEAMK